MDVPIGVLMIGVVWVSNTAIYIPHSNRITVALSTYTNTWIKDITSQSWIAYKLSKIHRLANSHIQRFDYSGTPILRIGLVRNKNDPFSSRIVPVCVDLSWVNDNDLTATEPWELWFFFGEINPIYGFNPGL